MAEVAVIGSGVGGLSAAIDLAGQGHAVTVFEARHEVGGKIGRWVVDGVEGDTGPSVLTMPEVFDDLFCSVGTSLAAEIELLVHDELAELRWPDGCRLVVHHTPEATIESVRDTLGDAAAGELAAFLDYAAGIWDAAAPAFVLGDAPDVTTALSMGLRSLGKVRRIDPMRTMLGGIQHRVREPHLRDLLARYATYNGSDPRRAPATLNCIAHVELSLGCYGVRGGMYEIARAMERVATRLGVEFVFDTPVRELLQRTRGLSVVHDHGVADFDAVVANADVAHVFGDLIDNPSYEPSPPSMSGWTALVRTPRRDRLPHGVVFPRNYLAEFDNIFDRGTVPDDPTVYVCAQEPSHHRGGWPEDELLFVMANAPATSEDRGSDLDELRARVLAKLSAVEWVSSPEVVWERTPQGLAEAFPGTHGAIYGASSNSKLAAFRRPANRVASVPGLYLASGSAHPGGGVPLCALSGRAAARAVSEDT